MPKIDKLIRVTSQITGGGVLRREFGVMLFLTTDTTLGTGANRIAVIADSDEAAATFAEGTEPRKALDTLFQQEPYPKNCVVGRWFDDPAGASIIGYTSASTLADFKAVTNGSFTCKGEKFTLVNLSSVNTLAGVAGLIQTKLRTGTASVFANATCTYNVTKKRFEVTTGSTTGALVTLTLFGTVSPASGTDISGMLGLDDGATLNQGAGTETVTQALEAIIALDDRPYFITVENTVTDFATLDAIRTWVSSRPYMFFMDNAESGALTPGESASVLAQFFVEQPPRVAALWSATKDYKALSFAGRFSSVNFSGANTLITGHLKNLPGTTPDTLTTTQIKALESKYVNYFTPWFSTGSAPVNAVYNGTTMKPSTWIDVRYFLDWAVNAVRVDVFNLLYNSPKVPQTEAGVAAIAGVIDKVMRQGVVNGGIAPGTMSAATTLDIQLATGNADFDGYLTKGYLIYAPSIASQSQSDRNQRIAPPFKVWMKGSGAIHEVEISMVFEN